VKKISSRVGKSFKPGDLVYVAPLEKVLLVLRLEASDSCETLYVFRNGVKEQTFLEHELSDEF
tara:strand:+ start:2893 stop:3081 length:189 start_codon:yes stop_codon:yes gene_type:complete